MPNGVFPVPRFHSKSSTRPTRGSLSREERSQLANRLITVLGDARGPNLGAFGAKTRARHAAVRESADDLLALVLRLRDDEPIAARGVVIIERLVDGADSPLRRGDGQGLNHAVREALNASATYPATITAARSKAAA